VKQGRKAKVPAIFERSPQEKYLTWEFCGVLLVLPSGGGRRELSEAPKGPEVGESFLVGWFGSRPKKSQPGEKGQVCPRIRSSREGRLMKQELGHEKSGSIILSLCEVETNWEKWRQKEDRQISVTPNFRGEGGGV